MIKRESVLNNTRLAGSTKRYHAWPVLQTQTVADHSWNVLRIYISIWGPPSEAVLLYVLWHDCGEWKVGDPPFPIKQLNPDFKEVYDRLEAKALGEMGVELPVLTPIEKIKVKISDLLDMWEFGQVDRLLGNQLAVPIIFDTRIGVDTLAQKLSPGDEERVLGYISKQLMLFGEFRCT